MHNAILEFVKKHNNKVRGKTLEVGSLNVNGTIRDVTRVDIGIDPCDGSGVDKVMGAERLVEVFGPNSFDTVFSCDAWEHMSDWRTCLRNIESVLKEGGYFIGSIASVLKGFHGYPSDYVRVLPSHLERIFPGLETVEPLAKISTGFVVQKTNIPWSLDVELIPITDLKQIIPAQEEYKEWMKQFK